MNLFEIQNNLLLTMGRMANYADGISPRNLEQRIKDIQERYPLIVDDFYNLTPIEALHLGFRRQESGSDHFLIPGYLFYFLPKGLVVHTLNGKFKIVGEDTLDPEDRFGCLAYSIKIHFGVKVGKRFTIHGYGVVEVIAFANLGKIATHLDPMVLFKTLHGELVSMTTKNFNASARICR